MSTGMKRDEAWYAEYAARRTRWSTPLPGLDNVEFVSTLRSAKPRDLFGQRLPTPLESDVLPSILAALKWHPKVAVAARLNTGGMKIEGRYVAFGFTGCPDIWAMLKGGQTCWVEVKRVGEKPSDEQDAFMETIRRNGGVAFVARSVDDVMAELA